MSESPVPISVALVDDHPLVAAGFAALLEPYHHAVVVKGYSGALPAAGQVDVVLVDTFGRADAPAVVAELVRLTRARVVVFSWAQTQANITAAVRAGAAGFLPKTADGPGIVEAVSAVAAGRQLLSAPAPDHAPAVAWPGQSAGLTGRESQVLSLVVAGLPNREIAQATWLSPNTVKTYIRTAYRKIGVTTRAQAVRWCLDHGFRSPGAGPAEEAGDGVVAEL